MYDIAVIGAGWAGFTAAREAASRGVKVCLIEENLLGGTCLNAGCIPTKTLVQSAKLLLKARKAAEFGIRAETPSIDISAVQQRKDKVVANLRRGMESRLKGIDLIRGRAEIESAHRVIAGATVIDASAIIICSGSEPKPLKGMPFDGTRILSSDDALMLNRIPQNLLIIGGGIIGCEFASIFSSFGSAVTVAEACASLIPGTDADMSRKLENTFRRSGVTVITGADVFSLDLSSYDAVIVSVGRQPRVSGLEKTGIAVTNGRITVDDYQRTSVPGIYAAGDCTGKLMLAHYAAYQGHIAALNAGGAAIPLKPAAIPSCIFTIPEIACIGLSEDEAMKQGITIKEYQFDFRGSGMAHVMGETEGMIKILAREEDDTLVGAFVIGPGACELGGTLALAVQTGMTTRLLKETIFAHPSLTESIGEMLS